MVERGEVAMGLTNVWLQTAADGLVRADQVTGIGAHQTPALSGKPSRWLLDVVVPIPTGNGTRENWGVTVLHRTLIQTSEHPGDAPTELARLLAQLDITPAAGVITTSREDSRDEAPSSGSADTARPTGTTDDLVSGSGRVRFRFVPFASPAPGHHTDAEYL
jgi:hypothetical protein